MIALEIIASGDGMSFARIALAVFALVCVLENTASAMFVPIITIPTTNQDLYNDCSSPSDSRTYNCSEYLIGVVDALRANAEAAKAANSSDAKSALYALGACISEASEYRVTRDRLRKDFLKWAEQNSDKSQRPQIEGASLSIRQSWPCPHQ
jgi:hypothetical protein